MKRAYASIPLCLSIAAAIALPAMAQDSPKHQMTPEQQAEMAAYTKAGTPGAEHAALAKQVGNYTISTTSWNAPGGEPNIDSGSATRTMILDGRVMVEHMTATMFGQPFTGHGMRGFDNVTGKYWATWNDSMSTGLMTSTGTCDAKGACTFTGSWVDPIKKTTVTSRMVSQWKDANTETFEMFGPGPDGKEFKMMEITYTRAK